MLYHLKNTIHKHSLDKCDSGLVCIQKFSIIKYNLSYTTIQEYKANNKLY
jgi:hypothetical protein